MEAASAMSMDRLFGKIKQLPTIPQLLHELMQSFNDENARIDEIAAKIAMDQVISFKVLLMANSAALRRGNEITSIEQAVIRLGFNRLRSVVVASGIIGSFKAPPSFDKNKFWTETFQVATIAKTLAQEAKVLDPETAFTCALIHNIGELLIQSTLPEEAGLINLAIEKGSSRVDAQRAFAHSPFSRFQRVFNTVVEGLVKFPNHVVPHQSSAGDFIEFFFNIRREGIIHYIGKVLVEEIGNHQTQGGRKEF